MKNWEFCCQIFIFSSANFEKRIEQIKFCHFYNFWSKNLLQKLCFITASFKKLYQHSIRNFLIKFLKNYKLILFVIFIWSKFQSFLKIWSKTFFLCEWMTLLMKFFCFIILKIESNELFYNFYFINIEFFKIFFENFITKLQFYHFHNFSMKFFRNLAFNLHMTKQHM